jgi:protein-disulfide isomerase
MNGQHVTEADVIARDRAEFDRLENDYQRGLHQLQRQYAQRRHELLRAQLDDMLDQRALQMEAAERAVAPEAVLSQLQTPVITDADVQAFYEQNKDVIAQPYAQVDSKIREYLTKQRTDAAAREFYDALRTKHGISAHLPPYRVEVADIGPARGQNDAPVTIVEFGDFQCPFCKQAEASLRTVMDHHPHEVRLVFRNLPLTQLHPNAELAAEAGVCAERQGKFWELHDAMYADQTALALNSLKDTAQRLGLDTNRFSSCMTDGSYKSAIEADGKAALDLGLTGTPYFFINGRPVDGSVPVSTFETVISEELSRTRKTAG